MSKPEKPDPMDGLKREPIRIGVAELADREIPPAPGGNRRGRVTGSR